MNECVLVEIKWENNETWTISGSSDLDETVFILTLVFIADWS